MSRCWVFVVTAIVASATVRAQVAPKAAISDLEQLRALDDVFGTQGSPLPSEADADPGKRAQTYIDFVRSRMAKDAFYDAVVPLIFRRASEKTQVVPFTLHAGRCDGRDCLYLDKPCAKAQLAAVHPWWNPKSTVSVCADSYHPEIEKDPRTGQMCEATRYPHPDGAVCRCGKYLVNCAQSGPQFGKLADSFAQEVIRTTQYVVQHHRPFGELLTMNETVRSDLAQFFYARDEFFRTGVAKFTAVDESRPATLRPRMPELAAGLLTSPQYIYLDDAPRVVYANTMRDFLCTNLASTAVTAKDMIHLGSSDLRDTDHLDLTTKTGCRDCHARLEYGIRAFRGWSSSRQGHRSSVAMIYPGTTKFYVHDAEDLRGEGPAVPSWIGQMMSTQPEFDACVTNNVVAVVYGGYTPSSAVHDVLVKNFHDHHDFSTLVELVVLARFVGLDAARAHAAEARTP